MTTKKTQTIKTKEIEHEESEAPLAVAKKKEAKEAKEIKETKIFSKRAEDFIMEGLKLKIAIRAR